MRGSLPAPRERGRKRHTGHPPTSLAATQNASRAPRLIAHGLSNTEISGTLVIAEQATKTQVGRILAKLDLRDRAQAVVLAYETGLVTTGESRQARTNPHTRADQ
jgi:DNA-binding NarL/FixJ family response regulator